MAPLTVLIIRLSKYAVFLPPDVLPVQSPATPLLDEEFVTVVTCLFSIKPVSVVPFIWSFTLCQVPVSVAVPLANEVPSPVDPVAKYNPHAPVDANRK